MDGRRSSKDRAANSALATLFLSVCLACAIDSGPASAEIGADTASTNDLKRLSVEELMNVEVTSASKTAEPVSDAAAAIYVITHDDITRSGAD